MSADDMDRADGLGANPEVDIELPNGEKFPGVASAMIYEWTDFTCTLVMLYPDEVESMGAAIRKLGDRAQEQYAQLESRDRVVLHLSQAEGLLDGLAFDFADRFIGITGAVLFMCQDGPKVGADLLAEQVGYLKRQVWREGGEDADDGDS